MPPIVYRIPPISSHRNPPSGRILYKLGTAKMQDQPIPMYKAEETHLGQLTQNSFIIIPPIAKLQTKIKRYTPALPPNPSREAGV